MTSSPYAKPWLSYEGLPPLRREFDLNRDEYIARQIKALDQTEKERRDEAMARAATMPERDKPLPRPTPPPSIRDPVDWQCFEQCWLKAQRDAALEQCASDSRKHHTPDRHHGRSHDRSR